jgi:hypothetical protein
MDPTTDFGFKKLFGDEANKDLTMSFLNDLLELDPPLVDLSFANPEQLPETSEQRIGIYDLLCRDLAGNEYLVEMQKSKLTFAKDRMVYYSSFPIASQAKKGSQRAYYEYQPSSEALRVQEVSEIVYSGKKYYVGRSPWNYELKAVYCVAILDFAFEDGTTAVNHNSLRNDRPPHDLFYGKLKFVTVELPLFDPSKPEYNLDRHLNKWLYFMKHLPDFERMPDVFKNDKIFQKAFWIAELANFTPEERRLYELNLKRLRDTYAVLETYEMTGLARGRAEGIIEGRIEGKIEGKIEGRIEGKIEDLLMLFSQKLGPIPADVEAAIRALNHLEQVNSILAHFMKINDWEALRRYLVTPQ